MCRIPADDLIYYGLEYKFVTQYLTGELHYGDMITLLNTAIHQFSKRQMTWFRRMERMGFRIHWVDAELPEEEKFNLIYRLLISSMPKREPRTITCLSSGDAQRAALSLTSTLSMVMF